jgi:hypothetical protein
MSILADQDDFWDEWSVSKIDCAYAQAELKGFVILILIPLRVVKLTFLADLQDEDWPHGLVAIRLYHHAGTSERTIAIKLSLRQVAIPKGH